MTMGNKRKSSRYMWCIFVIATVAVGGAIIYINISAGTKRGSSHHSSNDYLSSPEKLSEEQCISTCDTKECIYQSKLLLDYMKPDANPCEDFYEFACGTFLEKFVPEENYNLADRYGNLLISKAKNILDTIEADTTSASGKMKAVYDSCMKYSSSEFKAVPTVLQFLDDFGIKSWPNLAPDFKFFNLSLSRVIANFLVYEEYGFLEFSAKYAYMDLETYGVKVNASLLNTESSYERQENSKRKYLVNRILNYFSLDRDTINNIWEESEAIHDAIISLRQESRKIDSDNENSTSTFLDCTQEEENELKDLCETLESLIEIAGAVAEVNKDFAWIKGQEMHFMQNIFPTLRNFTDRSIANYLALNLFLNNMNELNAYFYLSREKEEMELGKMQASFLKLKKCVNWIIKHLTLALGHEYLKNDLTLPMIHEVEDMGKECIREAASLISQQEWMTEDLRTVVKRGVDDFIMHFGRVIELLPNETEVNEFYKYIQYHPTDENFLRNVFEYKKSMKVTEIRGLVDVFNLGWIRKLFEIDAGGGGGMIDLKFGILLPPTYLSGAQRIMNLVSLGGVILHEVGHNLQPVVGINSRKSDPKANEYFQEKMKCLVDQYSQFMIESIGKNLNGSRSLAENFADTIGISVVDKLIEKYTTGNLSYPLPSLPFSLKQQLYIYGAQVWCSVSTKESDELYYNFNIHSPAKFRLLGMIQNSRGFSEAFGCPEGSHMNPVTKCSLLE